MNEIAIFGVILFIIGLIRYIFNDKSGRANAGINQPPNIPPSDFPVGNVTTIQRKQILNGVSIPSIINNFHFYLVKTSVYEDGLIDTQGMADLNLFKAKLNNGKIRISLDDGAELFIFSLGKFVIANGEWLHTKESYYNYVCSLVKELNPKWENIYSFYGADRDKRGGGHIHYVGSPYYIPNPEWAFPQKSFGEGFYIIYWDEDSYYYLAEMTIYKDGYVEFTNMPYLRSCRFKDIATLIAENKLRTNVPLGVRLHIYNLGSFTIVNQDYMLDIQLKYAEMQDVYHTLQGGEGCVEKCVRLLEEYKKNPTDNQRQLLKAAYEAIPQHMQMYVGSMDEKDSEVRHILYGESFEPDDD